MRIGKVGKMLMKGIYLASYRAFHEGHDIVYQDINGLRDIGGDMMDIDLSSYDYVIATPPCNFWSRANWRRYTSDYSLNTKHLLPSILQKLCSLDKPFIVENVRNEKLMKEYGVFNYPCFVYFVGRHTYFTNIFLCLDGVEQIFDDIHHTSPSDRQGGINVHNVVEIFINTVGG